MIPTSFSELVFILYFINLLEIIQPNNQPTSRIFFFFKYWEAHICMYGILIKMVNLYHVFTMALSEPIAMSSQLSEKQPIICDTDIRLQLGYYCIYYWKYWWKWWSETYLTCWRWQHLFLGLKQKAEILEVNL